MFVCSLNRNHQADFGYFFSKIFSLISSLEINFSFLQIIFPLCFFKIPDGF